MLLTPGNNRFHRANCEGKLLDNGMNTPICRLENDRKTLDFLLEKCQKMREYRVFKYSQLVFRTGTPYLLAVSFFQKSILAIFPLVLMMCRFLVVDHLDFLGVNLNNSLNYRNYKLQLL